jgi:NAD(P)-dependent dehydrogenase (short-subunit alcohol dehydrogenase family)
VLSPPAAARVHWPRAHILVSSAGILGPVANAWEHRTEDFRRVLDVNLSGAFICCRVVGPLLLANPPDRMSRRRGSIVNVSSIRAKKSRRR